MDTSLMVTEAGRKTNHHFVLCYETERTILVKHEEFAYTVPEMEQGPSWVYLSSLASNSLPYHLALVEWLKKYPETKLSFQPGTFQMKLGVETLKDIYTRSDIFFCNKEEAERILGVEPTDDLKSLLTHIQALGPKIAVITDDRRGAYALDEKGNAWHVPMYPDQPAPFERTGAGDAFASSVTAALALGKTFEEALLWGPINAMSVVMKVGAQDGLLTRERLEQYLKEAPEDFKLTPLA